MPLIEKSYVLPTLTLTCRAVDGLHTACSQQKDRSACAMPWSFCGAHRQMIVLPLESLGPLHQVQHGLVAVLTAQYLEAIDDLRLNGACLHSLGVCITRTAVRHHHDLHRHHHHHSDIIIIQTSSPIRDHCQSDIIIIQTSSPIRHHCQSDIIIGQTSSPIRHHHADLVSNETPRGSQQS